MSTSQQAVFLTEGGEARIRQMSSRRWEVLPRGGQTYEVGGKQAAIRAAREIVAAVPVRRVHSTKIRSEDGFLGTSADGSTLPMLRGEHYANVRKAARHPDIEGDSDYKALLQKLLRGNVILGEEELRVLRHVARHPDFAGEVGHSLGAAADLHAAARAPDAEERGGSSQRPLTSGEIKRDIFRVIGAPYPLRDSRHSR